MGSELPEQLEGATAEPSAPNESDIFATLHHLVSRIDTEDRMQEVIDKAQGLQPEDTQLLVDCLSMALDKNAAPLKNRLYIWRVLVSVAMSAKVFARNHMLRADQLIPDDSLSGVYRIPRESSVGAKMLKRTRNDSHTLYSEPYIGWAHLSHPNVWPLFAVFFEGDDHPCLVSPCITSRSVCDYIRENPKIPRMPLISDIVNGLFYIHQFDIIHGGFFPRNILISDNGRAFITGLNTTSKLQDSPVRYSAPEILEDDDVQPTKAADMWSLACICYEVLSGKVPFYQFTQERKLLFAVAKGDKPTRPEEDKHGGGEINDIIWQLLLMCWEFRPSDRPSCLKIHQIFLGMGIHDDRPAVGSIVGSDTLMGSGTDLYRARTNLTTVLGSDHVSSLRVPEDTRESLLRLIPDTAKLEATATAAKKFGPDDTRCLVNFLDLVLEDLPDWLSKQRQATRTLLSSLIMSTRIVPQRYTLNGVQYDSQAPLVEGNFGKAYKGRGLSIRVNIVTNPSVTRALLKQLPNWSHSSHPNIVPFYGVFHEKSAEAVRLSVVTPLWTNGNLRNYPPSLPQKSRILLLYDAIRGLRYIHDLNFGYGPRPITPEDILVSNEGRGILASFATYRIFTELGTMISTYEHRFAAPNAGENPSTDIWSFGCLCYEVLSRQPPYYQYTETSQIQTSVSQSELPRRPDPAEGDMDEIDDRAWNMITMCCAGEWWDRPSASAIQELIASWEIEDNRPAAENLPGASILALRSRVDVDFLHVETLLDKIQVELLRDPLSKLVQSRINDVAMAAAELEIDDVRTLVDFLDLALKDHLSISEERNRVLALLSKITSLTQIFPQRYELKGIKYGQRPIAEGGFGKVYIADQNMCVKVMAQVDPKTLAEWVKELIIWAHSSHPNILPFYGVFLEDAHDAPGRRICLVSPYMINKNLHEYAPRLSQQARLPLILDVIKGLQYLHGLGIVHSDLKGQNVLISNEGRCLITDFGASHIVTATAAATGSSLYSTLRFSAPEVVLGGAHWQPTKECDVWSFGCLCYEVLSRRTPYHEYKLDVQVSAALSRKELPKRPGFTDRNGADETAEDDWDDDEEDWDAIDDQAWNLITKCCAPEPGDRLKTPAIQEFIADMKVWDERPEMKAVPGAEIFKLRLNPEVDLNRAGELLDNLQRQVAPAESGPYRNFVNLFNDLE